MRRSDKGHQLIEHQFRGEILEITLARAPVNAINDEWIREFDSILDELVSRPLVAVVVIRSSQSVFSAGADLRMMRDLFGDSSGPARMLDTVRRMQRLYDRLERLPQVTLAVIEGPAFGGGLELALSCDLRVAAEEARLGLPEVRLGLLPGAGGTQRLTRLCGPGIARRLILTAEALSGQDACSLGVVQWVRPSAEVAEFVRQLAERIASLSPFALAACKQCLGIADGSVAHGLHAELFHTENLLNNPDTRSRVSASLQKKGG